MGLGRFGGGIGVTRYLASRGVRVLVTDLDPAEKLAEPLERIGDLIASGAVSLRLGGHDQRDFVDTDLVIANAAVPRPWDNPFLKAATAAGVPIDTEIGMTIDRLPPHCRPRTVGITGSAGKSTTTAMIHSALATLAAERGGKAVLGGNIGISLLEDAAAIDERTFVVLELSSAQLHWINHGRTRRALPGWSPGVAVVTNVVENHLDWHGTFQHYRASKQLLVTSQHPGDACILGPGVRDWAALTPALATIVDASAPGTFSKIPGEHNRFNAAAAALAVLALIPDADPARIRRLVGDFGGLPHRLQLAAELTLAPGAQPVRCFNDSKSTTPDSSLKAIDALLSIPGVDRSRIHLIAGGYDKGSDLTPLAQAGATLGGIYAIGVTGPRILALAGGPSESRVECQTLARAVHAALARVRPGDCLLLSPGCASWDQYVNYEARGDEFVALVRKAVPS
jgi:UDP-N-acetylmuramoylalanine--D-glutamate ligase